MVDFDKIARAIQKQTHWFNTVKPKCRYLVKDISNRDFCSLAWRYCGYNVCRKKKNPLVHPTMIRKK